MFGASIPVALLALALAATPFGSTLDGKPVISLGPAGSAIVLVFVASDCPISNRYLPEVEQLTEKFPQVRFFLVFPNPGDSASIVRRHLASFHQAIPTLLDPTQTLVALTHVTTTPEAAILLPGTHALGYTGRIDDRYLTFGRQRPQPTRYDLADAIAAAVDHKSIQQPAVRPVGCSIVPR